ncbi:MAG: hypothetical protein AVDCRST_MAG38-2156, partial [uncultured Solirubrobacteraceae bacterium]
ARDRRATARRPDRRRRARSQRSSQAGRPRVRGRPAPRLPQAAGGLREDGRGHPGRRSRVGDRPRAASHGGPARRRRLRRPRRPGVGHPGGSRHGCGVHARPARDGCPPAYVAGGHRAL